jgi:hypothetical protein
MSFGPPGPASQFLKACLEALIGPRALAPESCASFHFSHLIPPRARLRPGHLRKVSQSVRYSPHLRQLFADARAILKSSPVTFDGMLVAHASPSEPWWRFATMKMKANVFRGKNDIRVKVAIKP